MNNLPTLNNLENIIFDFDGVILDSVDCKTEAFRKIYQPYGDHISSQVVKYHLENGGVSRFEKFKYWHKNHLNIDLSEEDLSGLSQMFSELVVQNVLNSPPVLGVFDFISKYSSKFNLFLISGTPHDEINTIVNELGLNRYFKEILGSPQDKIHWSSFLIQKYNLNPKTTIFLGDATTDYEAAQVSGFHFGLRKTSYNTSQFIGKSGKIDFETFKQLENKLSHPRPDILVTTTSFQDSPGYHHDLLESQNWNLSFLRGPLNENQILEVIDEYDGILCGDDEYNKKVLEKGSHGKLKVLSKYGVGLDKIDKDEAIKLNIRVTNCPGINQVSVAEHVLALILSFEKNIPQQYNSVRKFSWERKVGREIRGKTIGIIGLGAIGKELVKISNAIGLNPIYVDIQGENQEFDKFAKYCSTLDELISESDYVSLHVPLNEDTYHLVNKKFLSKMKKDSVLINTARGGLVDSKELINALDSNFIRGYLCDVLETEPISKEEILLNHTNIIITPHVSSRTYENIVNQGIASVKNLIELLNS